MRTLENWLDEYSQSHQNKVNQAIHRVCVPLIFFSLLGMLWTVSLGTLNLALLVAVVLFPFYIRLGAKAVLIVSPQLIVSFLILYWWQHHQESSQIFFSCLGIFAGAWIGQFIGHKIEGKKPSFFKDLQFLLIGPLWVFKKKPPGNPRGFLSFH
ncbi:MAG: Mpo1-like protein [Bdellovibrio sp.]